MIGATSAYIQRPFLFEGALLGASSAGLALALCFVAFQMIKNFLVFKLSFLQLSGCIQFINFTTGFFWILGGAVMGMLGSYICVKNINNGWASIGKNEVTH
jgi:cell division transport system permease protein